MFVFFAVEVCCLISFLVRLLFTYLGRLVVVCFLMVSVEVYVWFVCIARTYCFRWFCLSIFEAFSNGSEIAQLPGNPTDLTQGLDTSQSEPSNTSHNDEDSRARTMFRQRVESDRNTQHTRPRNARPNYH